MQNSIIFRPCPPACLPGVDFPDIFIPDNFWTLPKDEKLAVLESIYYNRTDLQTALSGPIEMIRNDDDVVNGEVKNILESREN